jgi:hypothetical protein
MAVMVGFVSFVKTRRMSASVGNLEGGTGERTEGGGVQI